MAEIFYKITEKDQEEFNKLEKAYFEMVGLQTLLTNIITDNPNLLQSQDYYIERYIESFERLEKQKQFFQEKILIPNFPEKVFVWVADFYNRKVKIEINE